MFKSLNVLLFVALCTYFSVLHNIHSSEENWPSIEQVKKAVTLKWEVSDSKIRLYLTGYETLNLNWEDFKVEWVPEPGRGENSFQVSRQSKYFLIDNPKNLPKLKLKIKVKDKESFDYHLKMN